MDQILFNEKEVCVTKWQYWATFTFDSSKVDVSDDTALVGLWHEFVISCYNRNPGFRIVTIADRHPVSGILHYHALMANADNLDLSPVQDKDNNYVFNAIGSMMFVTSDWKHGFNLITKLHSDNYNHVLNYIIKYMYNC